MRLRHIRSIFKPVLQHKNVFAEEVDYDSLVVSDLVFVLHNPILATVVRNCRFKSIDVRL